MFPEGRALEFLLAAVVALVVVGPKDLPILMRKLGQFMAKMRAMAAEFRASFDEMARQSELDELRKEVEAMRRAQFADVAAQAGADEVKDIYNEVRSDLDEVAASLNGGMGAYHPPQAQPEATPPAAPEPPAKPRARRKTAAAVADAAPKTTAPKKATGSRSRKKPEPKA